MGSPLACGRKQSCMTTGEQETVPAPVGECGRARVEHGGMGGLGFGDWENLHCNSPTL